MDESNRFDEMSTEEFRGLQEAPLTAENDDTTGGGDPSDDIDAGLATAVDSDIDDEILEADLDQPLLDDVDAERSEAMSRPGFDVVLQGDMFEGEDREINSIHSPDMFAPDTPAPSTSKICRTMHSTTPTCPPTHASTRWSRRSPSPNHKVSRIGRDVAHITGI
jgi:hypothetical protein